MRGAVRRACEGRCAPARPGFLWRGAAAVSCSSPRRAGRASPPLPRWRPFQTRQPAVAGGNDRGSRPPLAGTGPGVKQGGQRRRAGPGLLRATPQRRSCLGCSGGNEPVLPPAFPPPLPGEKGARPLRGDERDRGSGRAPRAGLGRDSWKGQEGD